MILSYEQVNAFHELAKFLRKLRIIGILETKVTSVTEFGKPRLYRVSIESYTPGVYKTGLESREEALRELVRDAEMLGLYD
jgi:hypothetical protein